MITVTRPLAALVLSCGIFALAGELTAGDRSAEQILTELDALPVPRPDATKLNDQDYLQEFLPKRDQVRSKRGALIVELYKVAPRHERIPKLMGERWSHIVGPFPKNLDRLQEIDEILAKDTNPQLKIEGTYIKAVAKIRVPQPGGPVDLSAAQEFIRLAPNDRRCASRSSFGKLVGLRTAGRWWVSRIADLLRRRTKTVLPRAACARGREGRPARQDCGAAQRSITTP